MNKVVYLFIRGYQKSEHYRQTDTLTDRCEWKHHHAAFAYV